MAAQLGDEDGLHERTQRQAVVGADEVDRGAHDDDPHDGAVQQQLRELLRIEARQARPQPEVRVVRHLRLHPDEVLDGLECRGVGALEQALACERRPVQRARAQDVAAHQAAIVAGKMSDTASRA